MPSWRGQRLDLCSNVFAAVLIYIVAFWVWHSIPRQPMFRRNILHPFSTPTWRQSSYMNVTIYQNTQGHNPEISTLKYVERRTCTKPKFRRVHKTAKWWSWSGHPLVLSLFVCEALGIRKFFLLWQFPCALAVLSSWEVVMWAGRRELDVRYLDTLGGSVGALPLYGLL